MTRAPGNRRIGPGFIWIAILSALVLHGAIFGTAEALDLSFLGGGSPIVSTPTILAAELETAELTPSCAGESYLASAGRMTLCFAPWVTDREQCVYDANMQMYMDLSSCSAQNDAPAIAVTTMPNARIPEQLPQIDPEKLIDEAKQQAEEEKKKLEPPPQLAQQQPPPPPPPTPTRPQQIVETAKPDQEQEEPDQAAYLSEHNTNVDKQKVNRGARNEPMVAKAKPEELTPSSKPAEDPSIAKPKENDPGKTTDDSPPAPNTLAMRKPGAPREEQRAPQDERVKGSTGGAKGPTVADGYMGKKGDGAIEQQRREREEEKVTPGGQNGGGGTPQVPNLKPTKEQLERALGGGNVDRVEDAEESDETALNSKRWVYASFFNRLKRQVAQNWEPAGVWRRVDPQGTVYGSKTRITEVRVSLAPNGVMDKIVVVVPSGVSELDDEAVRAFKAAAPFPNPPEGLVKDGRISFAFSFYFEIGQPRSSWRVIRSM